MTRPLDEVYVSQLEENYAILKARVAVLEEVKEAAKELREAQEKYWKAEMSGRCVEDELADALGITEYALDEALAKAKEQEEQSA